MSEKTPLSLLQQYFDIQKAFNTVPHDKLLFKLWINGINGSLWVWFKSYLSNRYQ